MNDGMYTNLRNYLEEIASQNKQILAELKRSNELLAGVAAKQDKPAATKANAPATVEKQLEAETGNQFTKTGDNPPTFAETDSRPGGSRSPQADKPAVPRRDITPPVEGLAAMGTMTEPKKDK